MSIAFYHKDFPSSNLQYLSSEHSKAFVAKGEKRRINMSTTIPKETTELRFEIYNKNKKHITGECNYLKIEKGNRATDWTPAPEDMHIIGAIERDYFTDKRWEKNGKVGHVEYWTGLESLNPKIGDVFCITGTSVEGNRYTIYSRYEGARKHITLFMRTIPSK